MNKSMLFPLLQQAVEFFDLETVSNERRTILLPLIDYVRTHYQRDGLVKLNFICTHNSRRSQLSQVWAEVASSVYGVKIEAFSGGVEVTALNERVVASLSRFGFQVTKEGDVNPRYFIHYSDEALPIVGFSKLHDDMGNPKERFAAVMTCAHADENCPHISGAEARISVTFEDPKVFDGSSEEKIRYDDRSRQIGCEMFYVFSQILRS